MNKILKLRLDWYIPRSKALEAKGVKKAKKETGVMMGCKVFLDQKATKANRVYAANQELRENEAKKASVDYPEKEAHKVKEDLKVFQAYRVFLDRKALKVRPDQLGLLDHQVQRRLMF